MAWIIPGEFWAAFFGYYVPPEPAQPAPTGPFTSSAALDHSTDAELWLIRLAYALNAEASRCAACGARLDSRLRLVPTTDPGPEWQFGVEARCRGWRRHRHIAVVTERYNDLQLGPFLVPGS